MDTPVIGHLGRQAMEADEVANYLEGVAEHVRAGHLFGFALKWDAGSEEIHSEIRPRTPAAFINFNFTVDGEPEEFGCG